MNDLQLENALRDAIDAHVVWKKRLDSAICDGKFEVPLEDIRADNLCTFGKFLHSADIDEETRSGKPYQVVKRLHADFHEAAARVAHLIQISQLENAIGLMSGEYRERSEKLMRALQKWRSELAAGILT